MNKEFMMIYLIFISTVNKTFVFACASLAIHDIKNCIETNSRQLQKITYHSSSHETTT